MPTAILGRKREEVVDFALNLDLGDFIDNFVRTGLQCGVDFFSICMDVTGDGVERVDAGVIQSVDCHDFEENVAQVVIAGILLEEFREGLLDQFVFAIESFAGGSNRFCGWCFQSGTHGDHPCAGFAL